MRRCAIRIFVFLLLGAIVNVAVAWACAYRGHPGVLSFEDRNPSAALCDFWIANQRFGTRFSGPPENVVVATSCGVGILALVCNDAAGNPEAQYLQANAGWPFRSVTAHAWTCWNPPALERSGALAIAREYRDPDGVFRTVTLLPFAPLWPGFAINTAFYAVMLWLLFAGPFVVRRWRRIRRGLCPKCAYDLRGAAGVVCPECGTDVRPPMREAQL